MKGDVSRTGETESAGVRRQDLAIAGGLVAIGVVVVWLALQVDPGVQTDPLGPRVFPLAMGAGIGVCGLLLAVSTATSRRWMEPTPLLAESGGDEEAPGAFSPARLTAAAVLTAVYIAAFEPIGYLLATPPYVAAIALVHGGARWRGLALSPLLLTVAFYAAFRFGLLMPVPDGVLETWLPW